MVKCAAFVTAGATALTHGLSRACGGEQRTTAATRHGGLGRFRVRATPRTNVTEMSGGGRKFLVGGNWKCNLMTSSISTLCEALNNGDKLDNENVEVVVAPPLPYLTMTRAHLRRDFQLAAQNAWIGKGGAFTGETDAAMVADVGAQWLIAGHSERRHTPELRESDATIAEKAGYALSTGLSVIFCVGELLEERESGNTLAVCERQMKALADVIGNDWGKIVIAYEPVWAIGTGKVASPEQAEEVHLGLRKWMAANVSQKAADETRILYGGSVSAKNCVELAKLPDIDGFLVGGASLKADFLDVVDSYKAALASAV